MALQIPTQHSVPPEQLAYYQMLYDNLTCRPPVKRNYFPLIAAGFVAGLGTVVYFVVSALT